MRRRMLIVYGTADGQTAKVARYIAEVLTSAETTVTLADAARLPRGLAPQDFDGVIVGSAVRYDRHQRSVGRFVRAHRDVLNAVPSAFFSVSGAAGGESADERARARRYVDDFLRESGWQPRMAAPIGGAIAYTRYSPLMRWMLRRIAAKRGGPTDTSRDHETTDWRQVRRFAETFVATPAATLAAPIDAATAVLDAPPRPRTAV
ncbi:MAG: flavodoxin domain-containing protein [Gemmatirosa sp.]